MKYAIATVINGNFKIQSEHGEDKQAALVAFHGTCQSLWNEQDVERAMVKILDEQLDCVDGKMELITHDVQPEPEDEII